MRRTQRRLTYGIVLFILVALVVTMIVIFATNPRTVAKNQYGETVVVKVR